MSGSHNQLLADAISQCTACSLRVGCNGPVPGEGPASAKVMLLGEAPGKEEDIQHRPFIGRAGRLLDSLLGNIGWSRELCFISNVVRCRPPNNAKPSPKCISACAHWLDIELGMVQPEILVLMGATAISRILGPGAGTVEHLHGNPIIQDVQGRRTILLPMYHPAAALYETAQLRFVYDDFQVLKGLIAGGDPQRYVVQDEHLDPSYVEVSGLREYHNIVNQMKQRGLVSADVETVDGKLWSVQVCFDPGSAYFIGPDLLRQVVGSNGKFRFPPGVRVIFHNYLYDYQFVEVDDFIDTMVMAYQLGLPQGLKELAHRVCGMEMQSYDDLVSGSGRENAFNYLTSAVQREWPKPEPVIEVKWDNKAGKVVEKIRNPQPVTRKIKRILADTVDNFAVDPYKRWMSIEQVERDVVESLLGPMPSSTIADILHEEAVRYSGRDADATMRVYLALLPRIRDYGLEFILGVDLAILPIIEEMMDTGVALDVDYLRSLSAEYSSRMAVVALELAKKAGHAFNPSSSPQVAQVVYQELGFTPTKFTNGGAISTDDRELKKIDHPIVKGIPEYRRMAKNKDAFADALVERAIRHGNHFRIHTKLAATRTETGRLSSSGPNLQAMPAHTMEAKRIRKAFIVK